MMTRMRASRTRRAPWALAALLALAGCDFDILNTNAPTVEQLQGTPSRDIVGALALGVFASAYNDLAATIEFYSIYGREGYNLLGNDPRETGEQVRGPQDPTGRNSGIWFGQYAAIRTDNTFLDVVARAAGLTDAERRAAAGFAKTFKAWHLYRLAIRTGDFGIPLEVRDLGEPPAPFVPFARALEAVSALLDEAYQDLQAAGSASFPFRFPPGFTGFTTPATFAQFNRALAAKVLVHRATFVGCTTCWQQAIVALNNSFLTTANLPASLSLGVYYAYSSAANEPANPITEPLTSNRYWVHPSIWTGAQRRPDGSPDLRLTRKVVDAGRSRTLNDLTSRYKLILYNDPNDPTRPNLAAPIPWITNEELILLRAEARWFTGDRAGALADINLIRQQSGGLAPTTLTPASSTDDFVTELLYNRLYSLLWTQGTRWIDARRYNRLNTLPIDRPGDQVFRQMLVPAGECDARGLPIPCDPLRQQGS